MLSVPLTQGKAAIIDDCDGDLLRFKWCYQGKRDKGYAMRRGPRSERDYIYLHKVIAERMGLKGEIDHRDRNRLNNRRNNLRAATRQQNTMNSPIRKNNRSGYTGVSWHSRDKKWQAQITVDGKDKYLGYFDDKKTAARRYNKAALEHFGEFAVLNPV